MTGRAIRWAVPLVLLAVGGGGAATAATVASHATRATVNAETSASFGEVLVAADGRTLYRFTADGKGVDRCSAIARCAKSWPDLLVPRGTRPTAGGGASQALLGTIAAQHGMRQVTYAGFPLYLFAGDKRAGQTNGEGLGKVWYLVDPRGALVKAAAAAAPTPPATNGETTTPSSSGGGWG